MHPTNLAQGSPPGVFPYSYVTQHPSLLSTGYDTGQHDIQQQNNLRLPVSVSEYLKTLRQTMKDQANFKMLLPCCLTCHC